MTKIKTWVQQAQEAYPHIGSKDWSSELILKHALIEVAELRKELSECSAMHVSFRAAEQAATYIAEILENNQAKAIQHFWKNAHNNIAPKTYPAINTLY